MQIAFKEKVSRRYISAFIELFRRHDLLLPAVVVVRMGRTHVMPDF